MVEVHYNEKHPFVDEVAYEKEKIVGVEDIAGVVGTVLAGLACGDVAALVGERKSVVVVG